MKFKILRRNLKHTNYQVHQLELHVGRFYTLQDAGLYILDIVKDGVDTFKPYKTKRHLERDLYQLFFGARNCVVGFLAVFGGLMNIPSLVFSVFSGEALNRSETIGINILGGLAQMLRGAIQIVTSPFSLIRIPFRYFAFHGIRDEKFQDRASIKQLVKDADELLISPNNNAAKVAQMRFILDELQRKAIIQNIYKKQPCYKGKGRISIGVNKNQMLGIVTYFTADYYLDKNSSKISLDQEKNINNRLSSFRASPR